jgi:hypothetical protein
VSLQRVESAGLEKRKGDGERSQAEKSGPEGMKQQGESSQQQVDVVKGEGHREAFALLEACRFDTLETQQPAKLGYFVLQALDDCVRWAVFSDYPDGQTAQRTQSSKACKTK